MAVVGVGRKLKQAILLGRKKRCLILAREEVNGGKSSSAIV